MAAPRRSKSNQSSLSGLLRPARSFSSAEVPRSLVFRRDCSTIVTNSESPRRTYRQPYFLAQIAHSPPIWTSSFGVYSWISPHAPLIRRTLFQNYPWAFWHDLCSPRIMAHNQSIERCLEAILSSGPEYLRELNNAPVPSANGENGTHNRRVQSPHEPRKKLINAATRLIQLLTGPEEYLDHLANSVSFHTKIRNTKLSKLQ